MKTHDGSRHPWTGDDTLASKETPPENPLRRRKRGKHRGPVFKITRSELERHVEDYFKNGGKVTKIARPEDALKGKTKASSGPGQFNETSAADFFLMTGMI